MAIKVGGNIVIHDGRQLANLNFKTVNSNSILGSGDIASGSRNFLGTISTTSGASASISGLNLTGYVYVYLELIGFSTTATAGEIYITDGTTEVYWGDIGPSGATYVAYGSAWIDLIGGHIYTESAAYASTGTYADASGIKVQYAGRTRYTTASTSITVKTYSTFDAGTIRVYGVD